MKTRWLPGKIKMPQDNSFEPIEDFFEPGNDSRAASFEDCVKVLDRSCELIIVNIQSSNNLIEELETLSKNNRVPYEFPLTYVNNSNSPLHAANNIKWCFTEELVWLLKARNILTNNQNHENINGIKEIIKKKIEVKVYKTDRCLTGKDKTNRAKRWEILVGDFQYATLQDCWTAEQKLITDLVNFERFPTDIKDLFIQENLILHNNRTICPILLTPLNYEDLEKISLNPTHGESTYQVGHLNPLKRGGAHDGQNVIWQTSDGNRLQGDMSYEEITQLLIDIESRRQEPQSN